MERTTQAVALVAAEGEIGAAVRAVAVEQAEPALCVTEQHQVLPEQAHGLHRAQRHARIQTGIELVEQRGRLPVLAHQRTAGGARADAREELVLIGVHGRQSRRLDGPRPLEESPGVTQPGTVSTQA